MPREDEEGEEEDEEEMAASNASMLVDFTEVIQMGVFVQARLSFYAAVSKPLRLLLCSILYTRFSCPSNYCTPDSPGFGVCGVIFHHRAEKVARLASLRS